MSDEDFIAAVELQLLTRPKLAPVKQDVVKRLKRALGPQPANAAPSKAAPKRGSGTRKAGTVEHRPAAVAKKAREAILGQEMLDDDSLVLLLAQRDVEAARSVRRQMRELQRSGSLIALVRRGRRVYPAFQVDTKKRAVFVEVQKVNEILRAATDPWGAASWWIFPHARLGVAPMSLVGTAKRGQLVPLAEAIGDDSY